MNKELLTLQMNEIHPYERNPRQNDCAVDDVVESIRQTGYIAPIIVDENNEILAGHTRFKALNRMHYTDAEVMRITGMTEEQKRKYRLLDNKVGEKAGWDFELLNWELEDLDFEGYDFGFFELEGSEEEKDEENRYTQKVDIPQYQIKGENPDITELISEYKADELIEEINYSNVSEEQKEFLTKAAYRHLAFNYSKIAEYYAHADKEMQELMEKSALVIIDYNDAIRNGFVELDAKIKEIAAEDERYIEE